MSKSKRKLKAEAKLKKQEKMFFIWAGIIALIILVILYFRF